MGMSTLTRLVGAFLLTVAGLLLMGGPALAQPGYGGDDGPTVSLSASVSGTDITATAEGFEPGEAVTATVFSDPWVVGTKDADSSGRVSFTFSVRDLEPGRHRLVLSADSGSVTVWFTVRFRDGDHNVKEVSDSSSDDSSSDDSSSDGSSDDDSSDGSSKDDDSSDGSSSDGSSSSDSSSSEDELAFTGSNAIVPLSIVGGLLLIGGAVAVVSSRRKRDKTRV
ncbi:MAG TPA: hypothetical protein VNP92_17125 [Actinophytocola sp.]|nr:hypothetical protein [Actinophytocola sp.]